MIIILKCVCAVYVCGVTRFYTKHHVSGHGLDSDFILDQNRWDERHLFCPPFVKIDSSFHNRRAAKISPRAGIWG